MTSRILITGGAGFLGWQPAIALDDGLDATIIVLPTAATARTRSACSITISFR